MAVPSNSALFEGIGGDFGYSHVPRAGRYTKINYELRYCSVRFSNRKGLDLKHALRVLKGGPARVVITEGLRATVHY